MTHNHHRCLSCQQAQPWVEGSSVPQEPGLPDGYRCRPVDPGRAARAVWRLGVPQIHAVDPQAGVGKALGRSPLAGACVATLYVQVADAAKKKNTKLDFLFFYLFRATVPLFDSDSLRRILFPKNSLPCGLLAQDLWTSLDYWSWTTPCIYSILFLLQIDSDRLEVFVVCLLGITIFYPRLEA